VGLVLADAPRREEGERGQERRETTD